MRKPSKRTSKTVGLIGYPLSHSLSPVFQQVAFDYYHLPVIYEAWEVAPGQLDGAIERLRLPDCLGANVTIPHKESVIAHLDRITGFAAKVGAVNTIVNHNGQLEGLNTDGAGFLRALEEDACYDVDGKRVAVLGAGGAARAIAAALLEAGVSTMVIFNRDLRRANALTNALQEAGFRADVDVKPLERRALETILPEVDLLINTTPVGMKNGPSPASSPVPEDLLPRHALIFDLVYNPPMTRLLAAAQTKGAQTLNGLSMLIYQGAAAFEIWTREKPPLGLMFERARLALDHRGDGVE